VAHAQYNAGGQKGLTAKKKTGLAGHLCTQAVHHDRNVMPIGEKYISVS
jgi:hypothetical protein